MQTQLVETTAGRVVFTAIDDCDFEVQFLDLRAPGYVRPVTAHITNDLKASNMEDHQIRMARQADRVWTVFGDDPDHACMETGVTFCKSPQEAFVAFCNAFLSKYRRVA